MSSKKFNAWRVHEEDSGFTGRIESCSISDLPAHDTLIRVIYSSVNFKDGLSASGNKGVTQQFPHTPGIDAVGEIVETSNENFSIGQEVIVTGYDLGMNTWGGFSQYVKVPSQWLIALPKGMSPDFSMALGTAGLTAMLCLLKLEKLLGNLKGKELIVSGTTGGVGIWASIIATKVGAQVTAISGKPDAAALLNDHGISKIIARDEFTAKIRPMSKPLFDAGVDVAGGDMLIQMLGQIKHSGAIAACGLVSSPQFNASIFPFILRGVSLLGIDSVEIPLHEKMLAWNELAQYETSIDYSKFSFQTSLAQLQSQIEAILTGKLAGRCIVNPNN